MKRTACLPINNAFNFIRIIQLSNDYSAESYANKIIVLSIDSRYPGERRYLKTAGLYAIRKFLKIMYFFCFQYLDIINKIQNVFLQNRFK
jgi:hypothetical protein